MTTRAPRRTGRTCSTSRDEPPADGYPSPTVARVLSHPAALGHAVREAADRLRDAAATSIPVLPVRAILGSDRTDAAYAVQRHNIEQRLRAGDRVVGRKVGLTSVAVQRQLGVEQPDFGTLLRSMQVPDDGVVASGRLLQPKIEAEIAFELGSSTDDLDDDPAALVASVRCARPALEIVDSRIDDWDIGIVDTIADNASSGLFVLGADTLPMDVESLESMTMVMHRNGDPVSAGRGSDCLGGPLRSLHWLAATMNAIGEPLRAGDIVLTGALGPMSAVLPGDRFTATIGPGRAVTVSFSEGADA